MLARLLPRIKALFSNPRAYWEDIATESGEIKRLLVPQVLVLAAIPAAGC